jgi:hypothetical protein
MPPLKNNLHERFCHFMAEGLTGAEAYRRLWPSNKSPNSAATIVNQRSDVKERIDEIRAEVATRAVLQISRKREILRQQAEGLLPTKTELLPDGTRKHTFDRVLAITTDARLAGEFAPERVEVDGNMFTLKFTTPAREDVIDADILAIEDVKPTNTGDRYEDTKESTEEVAQAEAQEDSPRA